MAYQDPYNAGQYGRYQPQQQYGQSQYPQQQQYGQYGQQQYGHYDAGGQDFNPYQDNAHQAYPSYEQGGYDNYGGGYRDDPMPPQAPARQPTQHSYTDSASGTAVAPTPLPSKSANETSGYGYGGDFPPPVGPKTASNVRQYRSDYQGNLWTRGGRGSCFGRFFCCTLMSVVFVVVVVLLSLVLWLRPPAIDIGSVAPNVDAGGATIVPTANGVNINMGVNISVNNPNFFAVKFKQISAQIFYPIDNNSTQLGSGTANNIVLTSNAQTNFTFPFQIDYSTDKDPNGNILLDLAKKCGVLGDRENLTVTYKIKLGLQILFVTVSPTVSNTFSFACPLSPDEVKSLMNSIGLDTGGGSRREELSLLE